MTSTEYTVYTEDTDGGEALVDAAFGTDADAPEPSGVSTYEVAVNKTSAVSGEVLNFAVYDTESISNLGYFTWYFMGGAAVRTYDTREPYISGQFDVAEDSDVYVQVLIFDTSNNHVGTGRSPSIHVTQPTKPFTYKLDIIQKTKYVNWFVSASGTNVGTPVVLTENGDYGVDFGDGSQSAALSGTHEYKVAGNYTVRIKFTVNVSGIQNSLETSKSITVTIEDINDPDDPDPPSPPPKPDDPTPTIKEDIFSARPLIITPECTGTVRVNATIEDVRKYTERTQNKTYSCDFAFSTTSIEIGGSSVYTLVIDKDSMSGFNTLIEYIPAFYDSGRIIIEYTISSGGGFDILWDAVMYASTNPEWYPYNTALDSEIMLSMISSDNTDANYPSAGKNTTFTQYFNVSKWPGIPPFEIDVNPARSVSMAVLYDPAFQITATNKLSTSVSISNLTVKFQFSYNEFGLLTNIPMAKMGNRYNSEIFFAPGVPNITDFASYEPLYVWAVLDGYVTKGSSTENIKGSSAWPTEVVKVFGHYDEKDSDSNLFATSLELTQIDFPSKMDAPLYRSSVEMSTRAWQVISNAPSNSEYVSVVTPQLIASSDEYRTITVIEKDGNTVFGTESVFVIDIVPNSNNDDLLTDNDILDNLEKLRFYDFATDFATHLEVPRSSVNPMFYERMGQTYKNAVVLQSVIEEPLNFIEFTFNDWATYIPIYDGQTLEFSDELSFATDGIRSSEFINFSKTLPNKINIKNPKNRYRVNFTVDYDKFKNTYVLTDQDLAALGI